MADLMVPRQAFDTPQDALAHYGVKGMKWGVRKDDRGSGSPSRSEQRKQARRDGKVALRRAQAAKADVAVKELQAQIDNTPSKGIVNRVRRNDLITQKVQIESYRDQKLRDADNIKAGKLSSNQKYLLGGAAAVGGIVAAGYLLSTVQSGQAQSLITRGQAVVSGRKSPFKKNEMLLGIDNADDALKYAAKPVNPNYGEPGGQMNCRRSTFTYELRRRGYDVQATTSRMGWGQSETGLINALTPGAGNVSRMTSLSTMVQLGGIRKQVGSDSRKNPAQTFSVPDAKDRLAFLSAIRQQPDGARGEAVFNFGGFGHSLAYERFGDKTYIFDTQKGQRFDVTSEYEYISFLIKWGRDRVTDVQLTRLDNLDLDEKFLSRWSKNKSLRTIRG